jgi:hypothetical protein
MADPLQRTGMPRGVIATIYGANVRLCTNMNVFNQ